MMRVKKFFKSPLFLIFIISIPAFISLLRPGYFPMHDDMQAMRLLQIDKCVQDGQIPCRWVPDMGFGYGYPQFNYYSPLPYYVMELFHLTVFGYLDSVKAIFVLSVLISAIGMWLLSESLWGKRGAIISTLLYIYAPYRAVDMYVRGAVAEFWVMGFIPFAFWSAREVIMGKKLALLWLALSLAAILTSHNITTLIFLPFFAIWILYLSLDSKRYLLPDFKKRIASVTIGVVWGFLLSAYFIVPAWFEKQFVHIETLLGGYFNYLAHFVGIKQLLFANTWGYGVSQEGSNDDIFLGVGFLYWIIPLIVLSVFILTKKKKDRSLLLFYVISGWISLFFIHPRSMIVWNKIKLLAFIQFPWRFLFLAVFFFSVASGAIAVFLKKYKNLYVPVVLILISLISIFYLRYFKPSIWLDINDEQKFSGDEWQKQQTVSIYDYLPIYAKILPPEKAPDTPIITNGEVEVLDGSKGTDWQEWSLNVKSMKAEVSLPLYDFPGWVVFVDNEQTDFDHENDLGLITVNLNEGEHTVTAELTGTPVRKLANLATLFGLILIPIYVMRIKKA